MGWPANTSSSKISHHQQQHSSEMGYQQLLAIVKIATQQVLGLSCTKSPAIAGLSALSTTGNCCTLVYKSNWGY
jgi:hypothetical protein